MSPLLKAEALSIPPACPSLLPVPAMNMELFCGWELAYVFCLISRPHSHFKGRSTRGLDFLICLATESTTCMWDQLPARADNPSASKYTSSPHSSSLLHCPSLYPVLPRSCQEPHWSLTGSGAAMPFPAALTAVGEMPGMFSGEKGKAHTTVTGTFYVCRKPQCQCDKKKRRSATFHQQQQCCIHTFRRAASKADTLMSCSLLRLWVSDCRETCLATAA